MTIHDATVEVTCDGERCKSNEFIAIPAGMRDTYIAHDSQIEKELEGIGWIVKDGQHFCSNECAGQVDPDEETELATDNDILDLE
jgi:hypothetical protein